MKYEKKIDFNKKSSNLRWKTLEKLTFLGAKIRTISWVEFYPVLGFYIKLWFRPKSQTKKYTDGWEVPNYIYKPDTFPNAVSGSGYIISSSILNCIYQQGLDTSYINLEDIFITGLSASKCNATLKNSPWFNFTGKKMSRIRAQDVLIHNVRNDSDLHLIYKKLHWKILELVQ